MDENNESLGMEQAGSIVTSQEPENGTEARGQEPQGGQSSDSAEQSGQQRQSSEDNHRYQAARKAGERNGEQLGYAKAMREVNERISRLGMTNGANKISNIEDLETFGESARRSRIEARAAKEGRSVEAVRQEEDNADFVERARRKDAEEKRRKNELEERKAWIRQDAMQFLEEFPNVDLKTLEEDKSFRRFCGSRYGKEPLAELYADYLDIAGGAARAGAAKAGSKAERSTGTGSGSGADTLTAAQQRELDEWNRTYPQLKMTAKEYLAR